MLQFHDAIKLGRYKENATLREKRKRVLDRLDAGLKKLFEEKNLPVPEYEPIDQGSYEMDTGVKPLDSDYDIDVGLHFKIFKHDNPDPVIVKEWVYNALYGHTQRVEIRRPCVTVFYHQDDEPIYHVDLAIYSSSNVDGKIYLAKGKQNSSAAYRIWEEADPQGLITQIENQFTDAEEAAQFRRTIRYLKRWKDLKFSSEGNAAPIGIGITVAAAHWFSPKWRLDIFSNQKKFDDLDALSCFVQDMIGRFHPKIVNGIRYERLEVKLPVMPYCDLFEEMTDVQMTSFKEKLVALWKTIYEAQEATADPIKACTLLHEEQFGDDFPIPSRSSSGQKRPPAIVTSSSSA